jgi:hypothetical protein
MRNSQNTQIHENGQNVLISDTLLKIQRSVRDYPSVARLSACVCALCLCLCCGTMAPPHTHSLENLVEKLPCGDLYVCEKDMHTFVPQTTY